MADYQKLTPAAFITKLAAGNYNGAPGARRAVGRSDWTQAEKDKAYAAVDKHFDVKDAPKPAKAADKAAKKAVKAPKVTKVAKVEKTEKAAKVAKKAAKVAPKGKPGRPPKSASKPELPQAEGQHIVVVASLGATPQMLQSLGMAHDLVTVTNTAVGVIKALSEKMPERSFHNELDLCGTFINRAVQLLNDNVVTPLMDEGTPDAAKPSVDEDEETAPAEVQKAISEDIDNGRALLDRLVPMTRSVDATA